MLPSPRPWDADGHVYEDVDSHLMTNSILHNEVGEASRTEVCDLEAWVCKHSPAVAVRV